MKEVWISRSQNDAYKIYKVEPYKVKHTDGKYEFRCDDVGRVELPISTYLTRMEREKYNISEIEINTISKVEITETAFNTLFRTYDSYYD